MTTQIICSLLFLFAALSHAQVPVVLVLKKGGTSEGVLMGKTDAGVRLQPKGATAGEYQLSFDQITEFRFVYPESIAQAQEALNQNQHDRVAAILKPIATPLLPYLDLPNNNGLLLVMTLADSLRRTGKFEEALNYFEKLRALPKSPDSIRAGVWAAHCHAVLGRTDAAWKLLQTIDPPKRDQELFGQNQLVRAQVRFAQKDYLAALDEVSLGIACSRMESELFPESLFLAGQCYEALADTNVLHSALQSTRLAQATVPSTNRVQTAVVTNVIPASSSATNYAAVAQSIYREIVTGFSNTAWAARSLSKLSTKEPQP